MHPAASGGASASTRVWKVKSGPSRVKARAVVNNLVFDAGTKNRVAFCWYNVRPVFRSTTSMPQNAVARRRRFRQQPLDRLRQRRRVRLEQR